MMHRAFMNIAPFLRTIVRQMQPAYGSGSWARLTGFNPTTREGFVVLEPHGHEFGPLKVASFSEDFNIPLRPGTQVWVAMDGSVPACILGVFFSKVLLPPVRGSRHRGDLHVMGKVKAYGNPVGVGMYAALPSAANFQRGDIITVGQVETVASTGVADKAYICLRGTGGTNVWVNWATAP